MVKRITAKGSADEEGTVLPDSDVISGSDVENEDPSYNLRNRNGKRRHGKSRAPLKKRRTTTKAPEIPEQSEETDAERLWTMYQELRALRFTQPEKNLRIYKEAVQQELDAAESLAVQYKQEYNRLKSIMEKKNMKRVLEEARKLKQENEQLKAKQLERLNAILQPAEPAAPSAHNAPDAAGRDRDSVLQCSIGEPENSIPACSAPQDRPVSASTPREELMLRLLGAEFIPITDEGQAGYLCTLRNPKKDRLFKFNLFIEEDSFDYEPVSIEVGNYHVPAYMKDSISFDFVEAPLFLNRLLTILYT